jgi:RNA polymerase sigma factor (sigma-70 family)
VSGWTARKDPNDLDQLFEEARRYSLLSSTDEKTVDTRKWAAVRNLGRLLMENQGSRAYLLQWALHCQVRPPEIADFEDREHHFLLRRELTGYLPGGARASAVSALASSLAASNAAEPEEELLHQLALPASLTVGLAAVIMRRNGVDFGCNVADALQDWERQWPAAGTPAGSTVAAANLEEMTRLLHCYTNARDTLVNHNLRLVFSIAGKYKNRNISYPDLVQEGTLGLIRAAEKYQQDKGFRFSTYSFNWISQAIRRHVAEAGEIIRYPSHVQEQVGLLYRERLRAENSEATTADATQLARATGLDLKKTRYLLQLRNRALSLDAPRFDDDEGNLLDKLPGGPFEEPSADADNSSLQRCLLAELTALDPAEREVVMARWGLHEGPPLTRAETADRMSVSREWVRQLERSALGKLRRSSTILSAYQDYNEGSQLG